MRMTAKIEPGARRAAAALFPCLRRIMGLALMALSVTLAGPGASRAADGPAAVSATPSDGAAALIVKKRPAPIFVDGGENAGVLRAVRNLRADLAAVGGAEGELFIGDAAPAGDRAIIVGTLNNSALIDALAATGKIDVSAIEGEWEGFIHQVVDAPFPGASRALVIAGSDRRGTIFGVYDLAERAGVSPWKWWADVPVKKSANLYIAPGARIEKPAIRYRGIFLNDEKPALWGWANETFGGFNHQFYEKVFELILRLKGNYLWPAMWGEAFYDDDPLNAPLAHEMGVVIGTSHHEPLARAHAEWARYGEGPWDYARNAQSLRDFWRGGMERLGGNEAVVTIGMRGDGDEAMSEDTAIDLLETIVADQRAIIAAATGKPAPETPQIWALYKEVQDYYDKGMDVPDDVTLLFADDNWGNIRRLPEPGAERPGGYGVYYHFDYVGGPRNYKWLNTTQIERVWEQMSLAWEFGARQMWIVNVGDLKPMEFPISFFLDYAWNPQAYPLERLPEYPAMWAAEQFGAEHAQEIGALLSAYTKYNARRKPELLAPETYSLLNFNEAERVVADYAALAARADALRKKLPKAYVDAFVQLVWFPIHASANLNALNVAAGKNRLCVDRRQPCANAYADEVETLFAKDAALTRLYHENVAGGKWRHMMDQTHIGYTYWQQPDQNVMPAVARTSGPIGPRFAVVVEGRREALTPGQPPQAAIIFDRNSASPGLDIEIFSRDGAPLDVEIETPAWISAALAPGGDPQTQQATISVSWEAAPAGETGAELRIVRRSGERREAVTLPLTIRNRIAEAPAGAFIEADGYVAFEAAHYARAVDAGGASWEIIPNLGRTGDSVAAFPRTAPVSAAGAGAHLEYDVYVFTVGEAEIETTLAPTLDVTGKGALRYAVSVDDQEPVVVNVHANEMTQAWDASVADYAHRRTTRHVIAAPGVHTVKLWLIDPAVVFQRVTVNTEGAAETYLGPPESLRAGVD